MNLDKIKKLYKKGKHSSGISCSCVVLSPTKVAKIFSDKGDRNIHYHTQKDASEYGLGPKVYQRFDFGRKYGYISERVYVCSDIPLHINYTYQCKFTTMVKKQWKKEIKKLKEDLLNKIGFRWEDDHVWNIGWNKNGLLICVDFGHND